MSLMSRSRMSSPFLSSRASMILCASSSAFRYHLIIFIVTTNPTRTLRRVVTTFLTLQRTTLYIPSQLVLDRFYTSAQSLLWLCPESQSLPALTRGGSSVGQTQPFVMCVSRVRLSGGERKLDPRVGIPVCSPRILPRVATLLALLEPGFRYGLRVAASSLGKSRVQIN